jgi:hypothetical protein
MTRSGSRSLLDHLVGGGQKPLYYFRLDLKQIPADDDLTSELLAGCLKPDIFRHAVVARDEMIEYQRLNTCFLRNLACLFDTQRVTGNAPINRLDVSRIGRNPLGQSANAREILSLANQHVGPTRKIN